MHTFKGNYYFFVNIQTGKITFSAGLLYKSHMTHAQGHFCMFLPHFHLMSESVMSEYTCAIPIII